MANIISLYLMLFTQLSASGGYEKFVKSEDKLPHGSSDERESP